VSHYRVCFDGEWQGNFSDREEALTWARAVGETGRMAHVARARGLRLELIAVFPQDQDEKGHRLWKARNTGSDIGG
jgi:hypothetical protein